MIKLGYTLYYEGYVDKYHKRYSSITDAAKAALDTLNNLNTGENVVLYESSFNEKGLELTSSVLWANYFHSVDDLKVLAGLTAISPSAIIRGGKAYKYADYRQILLLRDRGEFK